MKFLSFVFCAAALTASSAYGMKTPATATNAPQTSKTWKSNMWRGLRNVPACALGGLVGFLSFPGMFTGEKKFENAIGFAAGLAIALPTGETVYKKLRKAYNQRLEAQNKAKDAVLNELATKRK